MAKALTALLPGPEKLQKLNTRLPDIVSLLLVIACAYLLADITWSILAPAVSDEVFQADTRQNKAVRSNASNQAFRQLTSARLFGIAGTTRSITPTKTPKTQLNLVLKGVLAAETEGSASAIIAQGKNGKEDIYSIDEKLSNGVTLKEIHSDHVVLERQGRLEILELIQDNNVGTLTSDTSKSSPDSTQSAASSLRNIRQDIMKNPTSFAEYALPIVVKENGRLIGYRLQPQKKGEQLLGLGLEPNDVITTLNGIKLNNPQNGISALRQLSNANEINLIVIRNGAEVPLNIQLQ